MTIEDYRKYKEYDSQLSIASINYFDEVICKDDINEELVFIDVEFKHDKAIINYENIDTGDTYNASIAIDKLLKITNP